MSHFKVICEKCGTVISQCRCMSCDKTTTYEICDKCKKQEQNPSPQSNNAQ